MHSKLFFDSKFIVFHSLFSPTTYLPYHMDAPNINQFILWLQPLYRERAFASSVFSFRSIAIFRRIFSHASLWFVCEKNVTYFDLRVYKSILVYTVQFHFHNPKNTRTTTRNKCVRHHHDVTRGAKVPTVSDFYRQNATQCHYNRTIMSSFCTRPNRTIFLITFLKSFSLALQRVAIQLLIWNKLKLVL